MTGLSSGQTNTAASIPTGTGGWDRKAAWPPGGRAPLRRLLSPLTAGIATRIDVVFEEVLKKAPGLQVINNEPALVGGWFRFIRLQKRAA